MRQVVASETEAMLFVFMALLPAELENVKPGSKPDSRANYQNLF